MDLARAERGDLADLLATLTPAQWEAPSLCAGWRVRDVVAHVFSYDELGPAALVGRFLRGGILLRRVNAVGVAAHTEHSTEDLLALARRHQQPRGLTTAFGGKVALTDATIHHQDIRRPLGLPRDIPPDRLHVVLDFALTAPPLGAAKRIRGLTLVATDLDWTAGTGPVVEGPAEALLMALAGRPGVVGELTGDGQPTLAGRIGS
ncbi:maleylpyruvate isomerase family mycothiol-dependent enzyme [Pseudonocardia zijingensis]|jgi:uncharacterized protein (TIGR03083 family)|uniref:Maleylpyruvate isomerase family mycothiol-dependent enzyme n=1 Tax=Pseudonocardia zijingensis TaxID=153376 RepID=A0ABN1PCT6_9PSEU